MVEKIWVVLHCRIIFRNGCFELQANFSLLTSLQWQCFSCNKLAHLNSDFSKTDKKRAVVSRVGSREGFMGWQGEMVAPYKLYTCWFNYTKNQIYHYLLEKLWCFNWETLYSGIKAFYRNIFKWYHKSKNFFRHFQIQVFFSFNTSLPLKCGHYG